MSAPDPTRPPPVRLRGEPGAHTVYFGEDGRLTVEWYDFGADAPYESANLLKFDAAQARTLFSAMGAPESPSPAEALGWIARRFSTWFEVRRFAEDHAIGFAKSVDFQP